MHQPVMPYEMGMKFKDKVTFFASKVSSVMNTPVMDIKTVFSFE